MTSMPQPVEDDQDSSPEEVILGVDTHKDLHVAAVLTALGVLRETKTFPATTAGYQALLAWVGMFGILRRAGVECTGSYGAALARYLRAARVEVIEVNQPDPDKATRRQQGKTDTLDAEAAVRAVLSGRASATAKAGDGPVEMLRMFKLAKASAIKARTQTINQLKAVLVAADPQLRETLSGLQQPAADPSLRTTGHRHTPGHHQRRRLHPAAPGPRHPDPHRRDPRAGTPDHHHRHQPHTPTADPLRGRPRQRRRSAHRRQRQPRPAPQRGILRRPVRRQPAGGVLRQDQPSPTQPRWRPTSQLRALPHRPVPAALGHPHPRLPHPPHHRRQNPPRSHPLPQAIHRPRNRSDHHIPTQNAALSCLTSIGASVPVRRRWLAAARAARRHRHYWCAGVSAQRAEGAAGHGSGAKTTR